MDPDLIIQGLVKRGMPEHVAYGIAGNMYVESGFDPGINEISPTVPNSRGGYALNQWTGPRRVQYEDFAASRGAPLDDFDAQLDFTVWELQNTEKKAGQALSQTQTVEDAARVYSDQFLRPGVPHMDRRIGAANALAQGGSVPYNALSGQPQATGQNALAQQQAPQRPQNALNLVDASIDPRAFMNSRRF